MQTLLWTPCFTPIGMCHQEPAALHSNAAVGIYIWPPNLYLATDAAPHRIVDDSE